MRWHYYAGSQLVNVILFLFIGEVFAATFKCLDSNFQVVHCDIQYGCIEQLVISHNPRGRNLGADIVTAVERGCYTSTTKIKIATANVKGFGTVPTSAVTGTPLSVLTCDKTRGVGLPYINRYSNIGKNGLVINVTQRCCFSNLCNGRTNWDDVDDFAHRLVDTAEQTMPQLNVNKESREVALYLMITLALVILISAFFAWMFKMRPTQKNDVYDAHANFDDEIVGLSMDMGEGKALKQVTGVMKIKETAKCVITVTDTLLAQEYAAAVVGLNAKESSSASATIMAAPKMSVVLKEPYLFVASGLGHNTCHVKRTFIQMEMLLIKLIIHGPYYFPFSTIELMEIIEEAGNRFSEDPSLIEIPAGVTVIGDIRGRYIDLHRWLQITGWPPKNAILFLGGLVESSEPASIECLALVCALKVVFPTKVFWIRGGTESMPFKPEGRFCSAVVHAISSRSERLFSNLPFAAMIGGTIFASYGGCSSMAKDKNHIKTQFRPVHSDELHQLQKQLIFNQPSSVVRMYRPNLNSKGDWFGKHAVRRFCASFNLFCMIKASTPVRTGFLSCWGNRMFVLWSAPGKGTDYGAVLFVTTNMEVYPIILKKEETEDKVYQ